MLGRRQSDVVTMHRSMEVPQNIENRIFMKYIHLNPGLYCKEIKQYYVYIKVLPAPSLLLIFMTELSIRQKHLNVL